MRKTLTLAVLLVVVASLVLAAPAAAHHKHSMKPLIVIETMTAGLPGHEWIGTARGDINGTNESWGCTFDPGLGAMSPLLLGGASPGYSLIITNRGAITLYSMGIFLDGTWEFRNVGFVTDATGHWKYLLGWMTYAYGFTIDPNDWPAVYTIKGYRVFLPPLPANWGTLGMCSWR